MYPNAGLSSTRRLSEALFYFRGAPSEPHSSPRALKGHSALNTPPPPSTSAQTAAAHTTPPGPKLEKDTQRGGGTSRHLEPESPSSRPPKTNGILPGKIPRANGVLPSEVLRPNGVLSGRLPKGIDSGAEVTHAVADSRRVTRSDATRAAMAKPTEPKEKRENGGSTGISMETCMRIRDLGLLPGTPPNLVPTLRLTPVVVPPHTQIYNMEDRRRRPRDPSPARAKLRTGLRLPQETQQKPAENPSDAAMETKVSSTSSAVATETKYNGILRRSASAQDGCMSLPSGGNVKGWGSFRIPKKSERTTRGQPGGDTGGQEGGSESPAPRGSLSEPPCPLPRRTSDRTSVAPTPTLRTRLRVGTESPANAKGAESGQSDQDAQGKRCQAQRLRSHDIMARRYGPDIIRRGVLAS